MEIYLPEDTSVNSKKSPSHAGLVNMHSIQRKTSGPQPSPQRPIVSSPPSSPLLAPQNAANPLRTVAANSPPVGKSGKFIEKLQNENASLRRDYNVERSAKEEAQKGLGASKAIEAELMAENSRLEILQSTNDRALERKSRKIEELQALLDAERARRIDAEAREKQMAAELDRTNEDTHRTLAQAVTEQKRAETHADALQDGVRRLEATYKNQVAKMRRDLTALVELEQQNKTKLVALEVLCDQRRQETGHAAELVRKMELLMKKYVEEKDGVFSTLQSEAREMREKAERTDVESEALMKEVANTRDRMRWVLAVDGMHREQRGERVEEPNVQNISDQGVSNRQGAKIQDEEHKDLKPQDQKAQKAQDQKEQKMYKKLHKEQKKKK